MKHEFIISGIKLNEVQQLFDLDEKELQARNISRIKVDEKPGFPCRVSLEDANIGEEIIVFNYEHHKAESPYRSSGPIFARINAVEARLKENEIPRMLNHRYLSLRAYDIDEMMIDAITIEGAKLESTIQSLFGNDEVKYIQVHNAKQGCYNCQIDRFYRD